MTGPLLSVEGLQVRFGTGRGAVHAVNDVSFTLGPAEALGIVGESGSGKSVMTQALLGLVRCPPGRVTAGTATFEGRDLLTLPEAELRRVRGRSIAMIFQDPMSALNPVLTIGRQMTEAVVEHLGASPDAAHRQAVEMLELVGIANPVLRMRAYPHQFSGGQLQRVGIAMALACKPALLIADEPTTALDVTVQAQIVALVASLQKRLGMAVIWISHDLRLVAEFVDRVAVMYAGSIVETAPVRRFFTRTLHPYSIGLLGSIPTGEGGRTRLAAIPGSPPSLVAPPRSCAFAPRCDFVADRCRTERPPLELAEPDHGVACWKWRQVRPGRERASAPAEAVAAQDVLLEVTGLEVRYPIRRGVLQRQVGAVRAVDKVSLTVRRGETLALVGESGCGKSTMGRAITGLIPVSGGRIVLDGTDCTHPTPAAARMRRKALQMVFQNPYGALNPRMTIGRIVGEGLRAQRIGTRRMQDARVTEMLSLVGLGPAFRDRYPFELSGGQRQRVGLARALAAEPTFLIADEPISALDVSIQAQVVNLLDELKQRLGLTYLFIGHDLSMVRHLSDRVAVMYLGRIVEIGETGAVFARPAHPYTQALIAAIPSGEPTERVALTGSPPDPSKPPSGCHFHPRCIFATRSCREMEPFLEPVGERDDAHQAACHYRGIGAAPTTGEGLRASSLPLAGPSAS